MNHNNVFEKIAIIDFGSQFTQLIARRVRELRVYSEIINFNQIRGIKKNKSTKGIILSGGPLTAANKNSVSLDNYILDLNESDPFWQGQVLWPGYNTKFIKYEREKRQFGKPKWTFTKKIKYHPINI